MGDSSLVISIAIASAINITRLAIDMITISIINIHIIALQRTKISHMWKRKIIF